MKKKARGKRNECNEKIQGTAISGGSAEKRLRHFFTVISEYYTAFRDRFIQPGDEYRFCSKEGRMHTFALKHRLKEIGFDYDAECEKAEAAKKEEE